MATLCFAVIDFIVVTQYAHTVGPAPSRPQLPLYIVMLSLSGVASWLVIWALIKKNQKNAAMTAIITAFGMLALFSPIRVLVGLNFGYILGYVALLPITWGIFVAANRILRSSKRPVFVFYILFAVCIALWFVGNFAASWLINSHITLPS